MEYNKIHLTYDKTNAEEIERLTKHLAWNGIVFNINTQDAVLSVSWIEDDNGDIINERDALIPDSTIEKIKKMIDKGYTFREILDIGFTIDELELAVEKNKVDEEG